MVEVIYRLLGAIKSERPVGWDHVHHVQHERSELSEGTIFYQQGDFGLVEVEDFGLLLDDGW